SRVEVQVIYDELAILQEEQGLEITKVTRDVEPKNPFALNYMRITVDGKPVHDPDKSIADLQRCTDVALEEVDIQFRYNNLNIKPRLNVTAWPDVIAYSDDPATAARENHLIFKAYDNYPGRIEHREVRVFGVDQALTETPLLVLRMGSDGIAEWQPEFYDFRAPKEIYQYVLRVYDKDGNFDETSPQAVWVVDQVKINEEVTSDAEELLSGYGENRLVVSNIPMDGGQVKINGAGVPQEHSVWLAGRQLPVNAGGEFVAEEIFSPGKHLIEVAVLDRNGNGELYMREVDFDETDWFYVALADLTVAEDSTNGPAALVTGDQARYDNDTSIDGRLAYFVEGTFGNNWSLKSSADTREGPVDELFSNFMEKTPDSLMRRIDPEYHYPTFGDDASVEEGAPTQGKFYLRAQKNQNYALWGSFKVDYTDSDLAHVDRGLYGSRVHLESQSVSASGEKKFEMDAFGAEPGTLGGRDELRGTGGSLYFTRHRDLLPGSDSVRIETRDKDSGLVTGVKSLMYGVDYDIDYIQGRVLLSEPLSATVDDHLLVDTGSSSGDQAWLVVRYEYTPGFDDLDSVATGARVHFWLGDHVKLGMTASSQGETGNESQLAGVDITLRKSAGTWLKMESATTEGEVLESGHSMDGGFFFNPGDNLLPVDSRAGAYRVEGRLDMSDLVTGAGGSLTAYSQYREAGYAAPGQYTRNEMEQFGSRLNLALGENL
ncbi:MAG: flagellar motor protein MotB, partial [Gammaproteobacteria bacterium]|nr:flagellar motor protein MotB [Gammaproteobacteria bacterium]